MRSKEADDWHNGMSLHLTRYEAERLLAEISSISGTISRPTVAELEKRLRRFFVGDTKK